MKKRVRSHSKNKHSRKLSIELLFKEEIEKNNIFLSASLAYFFVVLFACVTEKVDRYLGVILALTSIMIVWLFVDIRREIRRKIEAI
jgi:Ca2+/Na+ antiporter